jgi:hypothetical protein
MIGLLRKGNGGLLGAHPYLERGSACVDGEVAVTEAPHEVKGLTRGLLLGQAKGVGRYRRLDRRPDLRRRAEEAIRGRQALDRLVRALEVVVLNEEPRAALAVVEIGEHRAREELLPHRLPEALDLAAGLGMMRAALHVPDAVAPKLLLKARLAAPGGVLASLVGQDLARGAVVGDPTGKGFEHERAPLVVRHHQAHEIARVIIQERRHVDALVAPKQKREEVRLPQLIGLGALKAPLRRFGPRLRRRSLLRKPFLLEHPAHRRVGGADAKKAPHHVANAPASSLRLGLLRRNHRIAARIALRRTHAVTHRGARFGAFEAHARALWITARLVAPAPRR